VTQGSRKPSHDLPREASFANEKVRIDPACECLSPSGLLDVRRALHPIAVPLERPERKV